MTSERSDLGGKKKFVNASEIILQSFYINYSAFSFILSKRYKQQQSRVLIVFLPEGDRLSMQLEFSFIIDLIAKSAKSLDITQFLESFIYCVKTYNCCRCTPDHSSLHFDSACVSPSRLSVPACDFTLFCNGTNANKSTF